MQLPDTTAGAMLSASPAAEAVVKRRRVSSDATADAAAVGDDTADAAAVGDDDASPPHKRATLSRDALGKSASATGALAVSPHVSRPLHAGSPPRVVIWDLDETLIIFNSLLDRSFLPVDCPATSRQAFARAAPPVLEFREMAAERERLANAWSALVLSICDSHFFFRCLESCESTQLTDHEADDDGAPLDEHDFDADPLGRLVNQRLPRQEAGEVRAGAGDGAVGPHSLSAADRARLTAYRLRVAGERYAAGAPLSGAAAEAWHKLYADTDAFSQRWLSAGCTAVEEAAAAGFVNVLVTAGCLLPTLAKLVLFKLDGLFEAPHAVLSARREGKAACFAKIAARYGTDARFCVIGDGDEEAAAAYAVKWPLIRISPVFAEGAVPPHVITADVLRNRFDE